jgi:hypothetical protein
MCPDDWLISPAAAWDFRAGGNIRFHTQGVSLVTSDQIRTRFIVQAQKTAG